ncbi:MAG TPA: hypothetical protein VHZ09_08835 [Acidobacteriaceae bacterium]|jgi:hypothetical protein|nr:hypothetical protein [Acidobacteriaceae bacterium]
MKRKLSSIEHMIDGNIVYFVRLSGHFQAHRLQTAIARLQIKHPALRMLIREEQDGLYYEFDCAPEIGLRILPRTEPGHYRRETAVELRTRFSHDEPQLRVVWLHSDREQDLLFVASHRICDGMSMLTIVREVLRFLHRDEIPDSYAPVSPDDIVGDYRPPHPWKRRMSAHLCNGILGLIPESRRDPGNHEYSLEWCAGRELSDALRQRCRSEGVSVHAALKVALDRALLAALGERKIPAWIESPMDARRGRLAMLRSDMLFFGGGSLKLHTSCDSKGDFWEQARAVNQELRSKIDQELQSIPGRYHFLGMLRPLSDAKIRTMVRMSEALRVNGSWNRFALSNLGDVAVTEPDAPFRLLDLRLYVHSFNIRLLGLVCYLLNGQMRFYYVGDEKCMSPVQADTLQREMMALLEDQVQISTYQDEATSVGAHPLAG